MENKNKASFRKVIHDGLLKSSVLSSIVNVKKTNIKSFKNIFSNIKKNLYKGKSDNLTVRFSLSSQVYDGDL